MNKSEAQEIKEDIRLIKENHLAHIEPDLAYCKANLEWLMKYHWIVTSASIGALVASIINLAQK